MQRHAAVDAVLNTRSEITFLDPQLQRSMFRDGPDAVSTVSGAPCAAEDCIKCLKAKKVGEGSL